MFDRLIESKPQRVRTRMQIVMSATLHVALVLGVVALTKGAQATMTAILADTTAVWLPPKPPPPPPPPKVPSEEVPSVKLPEGFQELPPIVKVPDFIPTVDSSVPWNERDWSGEGKPGGVAGGSKDTTATGPVTGETFLEAQVDDPVQPINQPKPRYPPVLQQAGMQGYVEAQFVVDTTGHTEPASWKVMKSTHPQFEPAAREAALKSIFKPARIKGRAVRQLVQQRFGFKIGQ